MATKCFEKDFWSQLYGRFINFLNFTLRITLRSPNNFSYSRSKITYLTYYIPAISLPTVSPENFRPCISCPDCVSCKLLLMLNNYYSGLMLVARVLSDNSFSGSIPDFQLTPSIAYIELSNNSFTGAVPSIVGTLRALKNL